jgi:hypothetical protein
VTTFQKKCIEDCKRFLEKQFNSSNFIFKEIPGKTEVYYVCEFDFSGHIFEIYIYGKEGGFMIDKINWHAFEIAAFDSENELIHAMISGLTASCSMK